MKRSVERMLLNWYYDYKINPKTLVPTWVLNEERLEECIKAGSAMAARAKRLFLSQVGKITPFEFERDHKSALSIKKIRELGLSEANPIYYGNTDPYDFEFAKKGNTPRWIIKTYPIAAPLLLEHLFGLTGEFFTLKDLEQALLVEYSNEIVEEITIFCNFRGGHLERWFCDETDYYNEAELYKKASSAELLTLDGLVPMTKEEATQHYLEKRLNQIEKALSNSYPLSLEEINYLEGEKRSILERPKYAQLTKPPYITKAPGDLSL